ncbi:MAG: NB-ARC domain-containing protein [Caldilineaceae bacterium]
MKDIVKFREKFRYYLRRKGFKQKELAHELNLDASGISHRLHGRLLWQRDLLELLRDILELSDTERQELFELAGLEESNVPNSTSSQSIQESDGLRKERQGVQYGQEEPRHLVGREELLTDILTTLSEENGKWVVSVDGVGGIGKTALAQEAATLSIANELFSSLVWISAASGFHHHVLLDSGDALNFEMILNEMGRQLGVPEIGQLPMAAKEQRIQQVLQTPTLIVLDNLETAQTPQDELVYQLRPYLGPSKALLTSRKRFTRDVYAIHLGGLDIDESRNFMRHEAENRRATRVQVASENELNDIARSTGGSPLAMKLVVGQLYHSPLPLVLRHLEQVQPVKADVAQDEYIDLYRHIYFPSWDLLTDVGQTLLISLANLVPGLGGDLTAIQNISNLQDEDQAFQYVDELWRLSLLEVGEVKQRGLHQVRYSLHALTQHFVLSDLVQLDVHNDL